MGLWPSRKRVALPRFRTTIPKPASSRAFRLSAASAFGGEVDVLAVLIWHVTGEVGHRLAGM